MIKKLLFSLLLFSGVQLYSQEKELENLTASPNPFSNQTSISFESKTNSNAVFTVYNVLGKAIYREKINTKKGINQFVFYKSNLMNGVYVYSIQIQENIVTKRFVIQ